ncbi:hypothetical protein [Bosea thiooxidans]
MPRSNLAPAARAFLFFGFMGTAIAGLTLGADLQAPGDQSSTTVALAKGARDATADLRFAAAPVDRAQITARHAVASPSQQAMAAAIGAGVLR